MTAGGFAALEPAIQGAIVGGAIGLISALMSGWFVYLLTVRREANKKRKEWTRTALEWHAKGGLDSLRGADLRRAKLSRVNLQRPGVGGPVADLSNSNLRKAVLAHANLRNAVLIDADLRGANLEGANLNYARLEGALLAKANLKEADLRDAKLAGTRLARAILDEAMYNDQTTWPCGFALPPTLKKVR